MTENTLSNTISAAPFSIHESHLEQMPITTPSPDQEVDDQSWGLAMSLAEAATDRKGSDVVILKVSEVCYLTDYFVIVTGFSNVQVRAIARAMEEAGEVLWERPVIRMAGKEEGSWALLDFGDVIAHIFLPKEREYYNLEAFWGHAERVLIPPQEA